LQPLPFYRYQHDSFQHSIRLFESINAAKVMSNSAASPRLPTHALTQFHSILESIIGESATGASGNFALTVRHLFGEPQAKFLIPQGLVAVKK